MTPQSVSAKLKKGGFKRSVKHMSRQVRGWSERTEGFRVTSVGLNIYVHHELPHTLRGEQRKDRIISKIKEYQAFFEKEGFLVGYVDEQFWPHIHVMKAEA